MVEDFVPKPITVKSMAAANGWPEAQAKHVLEALRERGMVTVDADDRYTITGLGLATGERLGIVKSLRETPGLVLPSAK